MKKRIRAVYLVSTFGMVLGLCSSIRAQVAKVGVSFEVNEVRYKEHFYDYELDSIKTKACDQLIATLNYRFPFMTFVKSYPNNPLSLSVVLDSEAGLNRKAGAKSVPKASNVLLYFKLTGVKVREHEATAAWTFKTIQQYHDALPPGPNDFRDELIKFIGKPEKPVDTEQDEVKHLKGRYASLLERLFKKVRMAKEAEHVENTPLFVIKEYLRKSWPVSVHSEFSINVHLEETFGLRARPCRTLLLPRGFVFEPTVRDKVKDKLVTEAFAPLGTAKEEHIKRISEPRTDKLKATDVYLLTFIKTD